MSTWGRGAQLEVRQLAARHGRRQVLWGVDLVVPSGEAAVVVGVNGAGKSTLLNAISGLVRVSGGDVLADSTSLRGRSADKIVGAGVAQVPQGRRIFGSLTVEQNLLMGAFVERDQNVRQQSLDEVYELFPDLRPKRAQPGGTLSGGQQQMLAIGRALMSKPRVLLMDEPSAGLAPKIVSIVVDLVHTLTDELGITVLLAEQNASVSLRAAKRVYVLRSGRMVLDATTDELSSPEALAEVLL